jgi:hypothetical protein
MQLIYRRAGNVANSSFDTSLLDPVDDTKSSFTANLTPVDDNASVDDAGAYLDNMPPPEGFFQKLPRNILIGLAKGGHQALNLPHDIVKMVEDRLAEMGNQMNKSLPPTFSPMMKPILKLSDYIPQQQDYDFPSMLGQKGEGTLMDKLVQGGVEYLPEILGGRALLRAGMGNLRGTTALNRVQEAAEGSGANFGYSPNVIGEATRYMPRTEATRQLIARAQAGEYPASFSLRSQLGQYQRNLSQSPLASERLLAPEVGDLRQRMLGELDNALRNQGMHEEADMLQGGIRNYAQYMRVRNAVMPVVKKLGIPTTALATIGLIYKKGKDFLKDY